MAELLTAAQMRAVEQAAIEAGGVTGLELMERAGQGVVDAVMAEWPELGSGGHRAVVLCGPGNNGGDGFVVARLLRDAGWEVEVLLNCDAGRFKGDAKANYERWQGMGLTSKLGGDLEQYESCMSCDLIVDALFGTGLCRGIELPQPIAHVYHSLMTDDFWCTGKPSRPKVVSIDIVSAVDADSGRFLEPASQLDGQMSDSGAEMGSHLTVTFHRSKLGHYLAEGPARAGKLVIVDIGLDDRPSETGGADRAAGVVTLTRPPTGWSPWRPEISKAGYGPYALKHKFTHGHALILSGGPGHTGAARLAARGALRIGAGVVTLGVPPSAQMEVASQVTAIMIKRIADAQALAQVLEDKRITALCLGPALGVNGDKAELIETALGKGARERAPYVVLDADALTLIAQEPALFAALHDRCVLTPHAGEFARLFPDIAERLDAPATKGPAYSKVDATREAARRAGCTVLFKGPDTVIADPDGRCVINASAYERAAPWLATAGSGDVLAGFITGLLARGFTPYDAASAGAWLHTECALRFGAGLIAEDLPEELPKVFKALGV